MSAQLPIVQYWDSVDPPAHIVELTRSFAQLNPGRPNLLFNAQSAADFIAGNFTVRESAAFEACGPAAMQADYLRYCALLQHGGIWADASFLCTRNLSPLLESTQSAEMFHAFVSEALLMNGLMAFPAPQHPFLRLALDLATELIESRWEGKVNEITGPLVITAIYRLHRAGSMDAFLDEAGEMQRTMRAPRLLNYVRMICDLIGEYGRVGEACEGIQVSPARCRDRWVSSPSESLPHRNPDSHWSRQGSDVYADLGHRS